MPVCCRIELCCEPPRAAADLADHEQIPLESAAKILARYQLVPREIQPGPEPVSSEHAISAKRRLEKLLRHNRAELKAILIDMGHSAEEG